MKKQTLFVTGLLITSCFSMVGCGEPPVPPVTFTFTADLVDADGNSLTTLYKGQQAKIEITPSIDPVDDKETRVYTYTSLNPTLATVDSYGIVTAIGTEGTASFYVTESKSQAEFTVSNITISEIKEPADGGFNYASSTGKEAIAKRTEILGKLEKYAVDNHLTGITLFENGGLVKYRPEVVIPTKNKQYINGYGFGILTEGDITEDLPGEPKEEWKRYYHTAESQDPNKINPWNATGSAVSDLAGYISSSYYGTKLNNDGDAYEWYPILAKETIKVDGQDVAQTYPTPMDEKLSDDQTMFKKWRFYVRTGDIKYRTSSSSDKKATYDNRVIVKEDYLTPFKMLLTGSNAQVRGAEMAGDMSYGIKGAQNYYNNTKNSELTADAVDEAWNQAINSGNLGLSVGTDPTNGDYIEFELVNPIDAFTARYVLSSNLYSPLPNQFFRDLDPETNQAKKKYSKAVKDYYGQFVDADNIVNHVLSVGAYYLETWESGVQTVFTRNDDWFEYDSSNPNTRYKIPGVHIKVLDTTTDTQKIYKQFGENKLHSTGIPKEKIALEEGQPNVYQTKGDSTFKLNVNSCTQEYWNYLFGPQGKIKKDCNWEIKPWMSNDAFLKGLYYSIDRAQFAKARGVQPSTDYFSNAYVNDPEKGDPYNESEAHKQAVKEYQTTAPDPKDPSKTINAYGYDFDKAVNCFKTAVAQLEKSGAIKPGTKELKIHIRWMYPTDILEYGEDIAHYFETAFNAEPVSHGRYTLKVEQAAVTNWEDVYNEWMMKGQFDLAFGAISGNTLNPLNFLEVLKSDNSSGFTLNWGNDTSKVNNKRQLVYDNKSWSFDALWAVADHGGVVENGEIAKNVKKAYIDTAVDPTSGADCKGDYTKGATFTIPVTFLASSDPKVKFDINKANGGRVMLYVYGGSGREFDYTVEEKIVGGVKQQVIKFTVDPTTAAAINEEIREVNKLREEDEHPEWKKYLEVFKKDNYVDSATSPFWYIEVTYNVKIGDNPTTQNYVDIEKDAESHSFDD